MLSFFPPPLLINPLRFGHCSYNPTESALTNFNKDFFVHKSKGDFSVLSFLKPAAANDSNEHSHPSILLETPFSLPLLLSIAPLLPGLSCTCLAAHSQSPLLAAGLRGSFPLCVTAPLWALSGPHSLLTLYALTWLGV